MAKLIGLVIVGLTLPLWGGALAAIVASGFYLFVNFPIPFLVIGGGILLLGAFSS